MKQPPVRLPTRIRSISRAFDVLLYVATEPEERRTATLIAQALGMSVPTTYHVLNTLLDERVLAKDAQRRYHLGSTVGALAQAFHQQNTPPEQLMAPLRWLAQETGESTYLSGWRHGEVVVLASLEGRHAVRVHELQQGFGGAAHARASGKLLLAHAEPAQVDAFLSAHPLQAITSRTVTSKDALLAEFVRIRRRGYALDEEEFKEGVACVAAPAYDRGVLVGVYTVSAPVGRYRATRKVLIEATIAAASLVDVSVATSAA
jgi:DNA-binding IclR family transcriptional regulator